MQVLGFVWLGLLILEFIGELAPWQESLGTWIWFVFILEFGIRFLVARDKWAFLRSEWLIAVSLLLPAVRPLRLVRVMRSARLLTVLGSLSRSARALAATMKRRGFGYVVALTVVVIFTGAAGMMAFEREYGLRDYGSALWWTSMLVTTMGSEYWPKSTEGRVLCFLLALYAFAVFGYVTATLATFFIGRDAEEDTAVNDLRADIAALREEIREHRNRP
jgi:voltage-gated potassium channel